MINRSKGIPLPNGDDHLFLTWTKWGSRSFPAKLRKLESQHYSILAEFGDLQKTLKAPHRTGRGSRVFSMNKLMIDRLNQLRKTLVRHHTEEQSVLTPIIDEFFDPSASDTLRKEHTVLSAALKKLSEKASRADGSNGSRAAFLRSSTEFELMARNQFSREENVIYWFASLHLPKSEQ